MNTTTSFWFAPLSRTGQHWVAVMGRIYDEQTITSVVHRATGITRGRHGRLITRDDLNVALDQIAAELGGEDDEV